MDHRRNRRDQQRVRMIAITAAVVVLLVAAVLGVTMGVFGKTGLFHNNEVADSGTDGWTAEKRLPEPVVYNGKKYEYNDRLTNYLLLGVDTKGSIQEEKEISRAGQSDSIFLLSYDRVDETMTGLAIPRDTITQIEIFTPGGDSMGLTRDHLNLQYAYGDGKHKSCELTSEAVSRLLNGVPVDGYAAINLVSIPKISELLGGIEVIVPDDDLAEKNPEFTKGNKVVLTAENTELFVRSRDIYVSQSAIGRMNRQKVYLEAFGSKLAEEQKKDASTVTEIFETLKPEMITTMSNDIFVDLAVAQRKGSMQTIPGETGHEDAYDVYRVDESALYKMIIDLFYKEAS